MRVNQKTVDSYKIVSWAGYLLAQDYKDDEKCDIVIHCLAYALDSLLWVEEPRGGLPEGTLTYLEQFVSNEIKNNCEHGIGMNGLFVAFHCARVMKRKSQSLMRKGWGG